MSKSKMADQENKVKEPDSYKSPPSAASGIMTRHRRLTDCDASSQHSSAPSSPMINSEPVSNSSSNTSTTTLTSPSTCTSPTATPRLFLTKFPVRIGITWKKGEKLEAMDFSRTWYPSKIVEIDEAAKHVLIHFEGWNQRYDEWVPMDSDKLRPSTRHSERKDKGVKKRRMHLHPIYRPGEQVLAKWTDCKKYPAKISRLKDDGMYEVIFYDGVTRLIRPMNIQPMPESMKDLKQLPPDMQIAPRVKLSFKKIRVSLPDCVKRAQEQLEKSKAQGESTSTDKNKVLEKSPVLSEKNKMSSDSDDVTKNKQTPFGQGKQSIRNQILQRNKFLTKKSVIPSSQGVHEPTLDRDQKISPTKIRRSRTHTWKIRKFKQLPSEFSTSKGTTRPSNVESTEEPDTSKDPCMSVSTTSSSSTSSSSSSNTTAAKKSVAVKETDHTDFAHVEVINSALEQKNEQKPSCSNQEVQTLVVVKRIKRRSNTFPNFHTRRRRRRSKANVVRVRTGSLTKRPPMLGYVDRAKSLDLASNIASPPPQLLLPLPVFIPSKAFIVEEDHNPFKCPHQGCSKDFRKENLLAYHIKYYHTEVETSPHAVTSPLLPPSSLQSPGGTISARKRRKKTSSICSTDSDISISSKGRNTSKRHHHDSEISATSATSPDVLNRDLWADVKPLHTSLNNANEEYVAVDIEDEEMESDVVNCVCGHRETNGLMIQCDVCMCWQHFACMDSSNSGEPPANYVCHVCEKTPGIRDSCRYMYDMSWERRGELPSFPFVNENTSEHLQSVACECNDMISALVAIKSALHSTRRQIKITKEDADPEFQLWQTDWDNWTKAEEDLTLTPRSGDPDPSPTPSTFLFPQAPCSITTTSVAEAPSPAVQVPGVNNLTSTSLPVSSSQNLLCTESSISSKAPEASSSVSSSLPPFSQSSLKLSQLAMALSSSDPLTSPALPNASMLIPNTIPSSNNIHFTSNQAQNKAIDKGILSSGLTQNSQHLSRHEYSDSHPESSGSMTESKNQTDVTKFTKQSDSWEITKFLGGNKLADNESTASQNQLISPSTSLSHAASPVSLSSSLSTQGASQQAKPNTQDTIVNKDQAAISFDFINSDKTTEEIQAQVTSSSNGHDDRLGQTNSARTEAGVGSLDNHMTSLYVEVSGGQGHQAGCQDDDDDDDAPDNDTDTAEESLDPYRNCEHNLLIHVTRVHSDIEKHLEALEQQIAELENSEHNNPTVQLSEDNILNDVPALKKSLGKHNRNLVKVQKFCVLP